MSEKKINKVQDLSQSVKQRTVNFLMKQKSLGELNKEKIMQTLAFNHPNGRTTHELKIDTGLDRDTIYTHGEDLKKSGLVIKKGKFGKYHLTEKALSDPSIGSWIFRGEVMRGITKWSVPGSRPNKFCNIDTQNRDKEYQTERELFDFANKLSALITYILLHALRPRDISFNGTSKKKIKLSGKEKTEQATRWVENTISPARLLFEFSKLRPVKKGLAVYGEVQPALKDQYRTMDINDPLWTDYELNEENFKKLTMAFANIYPEINEQLENIRKTLPDKIEEHKESNRKYLEEQQQKKP
jgi:hypothetical protein